MSMRNNSGASLPKAGNRSVGSRPALYGSARAQSGEPGRKGVATNKIHSFKPRTNKNTPYKGPNTTKKNSNISGFESGGGCEVGFTPY